MFQFLVSVAHAQTWTTASTTTLVSNVETSLAAQIVGALPIIIPITIGLAVFFFFFRWLLARGRGRH